MAEQDKEINRLRAELDTMVKERDKEWQIIVESGECSDSVKAAGILRARVRIHRKENEG